MWDSVSSADSSILTAVTLPQAPKLIAKKTGTKAIKLTWKTKTSADGFVVQMKTLNGSFHRIALKKANASVSVKRQLKAGKTYVFRIRGYKLEGKEKIYSRWSKTRKVHL